MFAEIVTSDSGNLIFSNINTKTDYIGFTQLTWTQSNNQIVNLCVIEICDVTMGGLHYMITNMVGVKNKNHVTILKGNIIICFPM